MEMLCEAVVLQLRTKANFDEQHFQQNGASSHYARTGREYLAQALPQRWFRRWGNTKWQPRSCDLTRTDFFFGV